MSENIFLIKSDSLKCITSLNQTRDKTEHPTEERKSVIYKKNNSERRTMYIHKNARTTEGTKYKKKKKTKEETYRNDPIRSSHCAKPKIKER